MQQANQHLAERHQQQQQQHQQQQQQNGPKTRGRRKKVRTEPIRPICPQCEKQFSNQSALTKHKLTHSDERKFACQQCSKAFKRHDHLTGHMQTHSNRKPFNCTIQGCDKTYCDARSLRRHKENIHHIVTPKELQQQQQQQQNGHDNSSSISDSGLELNVQYEQQITPNNHHNHHHDINNNTTTTTTTTTTDIITTATTTTHNHHQPPAVPTPSFVARSSSDQQQPPLHLLPRRIQRLHSDSGVSYPYAPSSATSTVNSDEQSPSSSGRMDLIRHPDPVTVNHHHQAQQQHHQASYSADYASTQHFSFDPNHMNQMDQPLISSSNTIPHSADSISDSGLGLNAQYEQQMIQNDHHTLTNSTQQQQQQHANGGYLTPIVLHRTTPNNSAHFNEQQPPQPTYRQPIGPPPSFVANSSDQHPSHQLSRRIQQQQPHPHPHHHHHHQQQQHYHQASYSADYASTQHFSFDPNHMNQMDQPLISSSNTIPHSADSISDSGLGLNAQYEQQMIQSNHHTLTNSTPPQQQQQQQQNANGGYLKPIVLHRTTPNNGGAHFNEQPPPQPTYHQPIVPPPSFVANSANQQPSHLLRRRIQRLHSDSGVYPTVEEQPNQSDPVRQPMHSLVSPQHHYQQTSYPVEYASEW